MFFGSLFRLPKIHFLNNKNYVSQGWILKMLKQGRKKIENHCSRSTNRFLSIFFLNRTFFLFSSSVLFSRFLGLNSSPTRGHGNVH